MSRVHFHTREIFVQLIEVRILFTYRIFDKVDKIATKRIFIK